MAILPDSGPSLGRGGPLRALPKTPEKLKKNLLVPASLCGAVQNEAETVSENWHKSGTVRSQHVPSAQTKNAAQGEDLDGADAKKKAGAFKGNCYHELSSAARQAAAWFAENRDKCPRPIIPFLKGTFGITALEAVLAIQAAKAGDK